jgi:hypothetical protein
VRVGDGRVPRKEDWRVGGWERSRENERWEKEGVIPRWRPKIFSFHELSVGDTSRSDTSLFHGHMSNFILDISRVVS